MATVELRDVRKRYGTTEVIHGVTLSIADGEFLVIVGPSGCGKSTLLRMVAGLEEISAGEILIGGRTVNDLEPKDRDIAMVFQNYALYPHMKVYDNMAYGLKIRGLDRTQIDSRVRQAADILGLQELLNRRPRELSGGQRQRVAMGRAIVREPQVFLFDEPLSNLDAKLRVQMRLELQRLHRRLGVTSLYVTHDQVEAMTLGERIIVMNRGVAEQVGTPAEVWQRPATTFVAGFIGSPPMNLLKAELGADGSVTVGEGVRVRWPAGWRAPPTREVVLGVRPEDLRPAAAGEGWPMTVDTVETLGADRLVHGALAGQPVVMRVAADIAFDPGTRIAVTCDPARLHGFDRADGRRIDG